MIISGSFFPLKCWIFSSTFHCATIVEVRGRRRWKRGLVRAEVAAARPWEGGREGGRKEGAIGIRYAQIGEGNSRLSAASIRRSAGEICVLYFEIGLVQFDMCTTS